MTGRNDGRLDVWVALRCEVPVPEIGRIQGLRTSETTTPTGMSGRWVNYVLGGPGRNRTTDTRIFNPLLYQLSYQAKEQNYSRLERNCKGVFFRPDFCW